MVIEEKEALGKCLRKKIAMVEIMKDVIIGVDLK